MKEHVRVAGGAAAASSAAAAGGSGYYGGDAAAASSAGASLCFVFFTFFQPFASQVIAQTQVVLLCTESHMSACLRMRACQPVPSTPCQCQVLHATLV